MRIASIARRASGVVTLAALLLAGCGQGGDPAAAPESPSPSGSGTPAAPEAKQPTTLEEWALYEGADRAALLEQGAKEEGTVSVYMSVTKPVAEALAAAYEEKTGIQVELWRSNGEEIVQRLLAEVRAGKPGADVVENTNVDLTKLRREGVLLPFKTPVTADYPASAGDPDGYYWATRQTFFVPAYNTNSLKREDLPKTYEDLATMAYDGKIGLEAEDYDWFAMQVRLMGEEKGLAFFKKVAERNGFDLRKGHPLLAELTSAGEIPFTLTAYSHNVEQQKAKGAPIDWYPLEPVVTRPSAVSLVKDAAHPRAALHFIDFLLSREGQAIYASQNAVPANPNVDSNPPGMNKGFEAVPVDPVVVLDELEKWQKLFEETFGTSSQ